MHFLSKSRHRINVCSSFFALCILMVFAGGRWSHYEVGYDLPVFDYGTYKNIYLSPLYIPDFFQEYASAGYEIKSMEPGYLLYSSLCTLLFGSHYNLYLLFTNCILIILLYKSLRNNNIKYAYFFFAILFASRLYLQYNFILLRQAIALSIVWAWGFPYLVKGNRGKFFLVVFSASLFHFTALLSLLALFFQQKFQCRVFHCRICYFNGIKYYRSNGQFIPVINATRFVGSRHIRRIGREIRENMWRMMISGN